MVGSKNPSSDHYKVTTPHTHEYVNKKTPRSSQKLLDTMRTILQPHEIWQEMDEKRDPTAKIYLRVFDLPHGKKAMLGVRRESESKIELSEEEKKECREEVVTNRARGLKYLRLLVNSKRPTATPAPRRYADNSTPAARAALANRTPQKDSRSLSLRYPPDLPETADRVL